MLYFTVSVLFLFHVVLAVNFSLNRPTLFYVITLRICCHNTELVHVNGHVRIILVICINTNFELMKKVTWVECVVGLGKMEGKYRPTLFLSVNLRANDNSMGQRCQHFGAGDIFDTFLGAFAKLWKAIITFMSVRLSPWNNSFSTGRNFLKIHIWLFFEKTS